MAKKIDAESCKQIDEAVRKIVQEHKSLLEILRMSSAERWLALDQAISQAAADADTPKWEVMIRIGRAMEKEDPERYARSLKSMISRGKRQKGTANAPKERKKGFEALFGKLEKLELTEEQLERLLALLENRRRGLSYNPRQGPSSHLRPIWAEVVNN